jgi:hypothetical protein
MSGIWNDDARKTPPAQPAVGTEHTMKFGFWFDYDQTYTFVDVYHALARRLPGAQVTGIVVGTRYLPHAVEKRRDG